MPKIIPDVRRAAIAAVRRRAAVRGWKALEIRSLAAACGVAAGTLYNYFPSREAIAAAALREDRLDACRRLLALPEGGSVMENLRAVFGELAGFLKRYRWLCTDATANPDRRGGNELAGELRRFHKELERIVARVIGGHGAAEGVDPGFLPKFLARLLIQWAQDPRSSWSLLSGIVARLVEEKRSVPQP